MQEKRERWMQLAEMAAAEQDPAELLKLISEINDLLAQKEDRLLKLRAQIPKPSGDGG